RRSFRHGRRWLRRLWPDAANESLPQLAMIVIDYVDHRRAVERLAKLSRQIMPDGLIPLEEERLLVFPRLAREALRDALGLLDQILSSSWLGPLLDEFLVRGGKPGPVEDDVRQRVASLPALSRPWEQLVAANRTLVPGWQPSADQNHQLRYPEAAGRAL